MKRVHSVSDINDGANGHGTGPGNVLGNMTSRFLSAVGFLTKIPVPGWALMDQSSLAASPSYFPAVGAVIGFGLAVCDSFFTWLFSLPVVCVLDLTLLFAVTGGMHCDGLIDTADGLLGGTIREDALRIMRDSRIGAMGAITVVLLFLSKYALLISLPDLPVEAGKLASLGIAHSMCNVLAGVQAGAVRLGITGLLGRLNLARGVPSCCILPVGGRLAALLLAPVMGRWAMLLAISIFPYARKESGMGTVFACAGRESGKDQGQEQQQGQPVVHDHTKRQSQEQGNNRRPRRRLYVPAALIALMGTGVAGIRGAFAFVLCSLVTLLWGEKYRPF